VKAAETASELRGLTGDTNSHDVMDIGPTAAWPGNDVRLSQLSGGRDDVEEPVVTNASHPRAIQGVIPHGVRFTIGP
jgi:hypothetical protein